MTETGQREMKPLAWYVMCDLKRRNALVPAYKMLQGKGFEVFTPLIRKVIGKGKSKKVVEMPFISDLLFVHSTMTMIDPVVEITPTLRYRFVKGGRYREAVTVREDDMNRFINAVNSVEQHEYFSIDELPKEKVGSTVLIHGGPLDGYRVSLKKMRGTRKKHVYIELSGLLYADIELAEFDSIEIVEKH